MAVDRLRRRLSPVGIAGLLLAIAGCAQLPTTAASAIPPVPPQEARIWFYRDLNPHEGMGTPYIRLDGVIAGIAQQGGAFYRDVPAGQHRIAVDSYINDGNQWRDVAVAPGGEIFAKIVPLDNYEEGGGEFSSGYHRDVFYLWLYPPAAARPAIAGSAFYGGGTLTAAAPVR
jgi:hypothetical protein